MLLMYTYMLLMCTRTCYTYTHIFIPVVVNIFVSDAIHVIPIQIVELMLTLRV